MVMGGHAGLAVLLLIGISLANASKDENTKVKTGIGGGDLSNIFGKMLQNTGEALANKAKGNTNELTKVKSEVQIEYTKNGSLEGRKEKNQRPLRGNKNDKNKNESERGKEKSFNIFEQLAKEAKENGGKGSKTNGENDVQQKKSGNKRNDKVRDKKEREETIQNVNENDEEDEFNGIQMNKEYEEEKGMKTKEQDNKMSDKQKPLMERANEKGEKKPKPKNIDER